MNINDAIKEGKLKYTSDYIAEDTENITIYFEVDKDVLNTDSKAELSIEMPVSNMEANQASVLLNDSKNSIWADCDMHCSDIEALINFYLKERKI